MDEANRQNVIPFPGPKTQAQSSTFDGHVDYQGQRLSLEDISKLPADEQSNILREMIARAAGLPVNAGEPSQKLSFAQQILEAHERSGEA